MGPKIQPDAPQRDKIRLLLIGANATLSDLRVFRAQANCAANELFDQSFCAQHTRCAQQSTGREQLINHPVSCAPQAQSRACLVACLRHT